MPLVARAGWRALLRTDLNAVAALQLADFAARWVLPDEPLRNSIGNG
jgi:hypothetical protein